MDEGQRDAQVLPPLLVEFSKVILLVQEVSLMRCVLKVNGLKGDTLNP
jgi:hypothetical protein